MIRFLDNSVILLKKCLEIYPEVVLTLITHVIYFFCDKKRNLSKK